MIIEICLLVFLILFCILAHKIEKLEDTVNGKEAHFDFNSRYDFIGETKSLLSKINELEKEIPELKRRVWNIEIDTQHEGRDSFRHDTLGEKTDENRGINGELHDTLYALMRFLKVKEVLISEHLEIKKITKK